MLGRFCRWATSLGVGLNGAEVSSLNHWKDGGANTRQGGRCWRHRVGQL